MGHVFTLISYSGLNVGCVKTVASRNVINEHQEPFELYILAKSLGSHAEGFLPDSDRPIHLFRNAGKLRLAAICSTPTFTKH